MKQRTISAIIALLIFIPIFVIGGILFKLSIIVLGLLGLREIIKAREDKRNFPTIVKYLSFILLAVLMYNNADSKELVLSIDYKMISMVLLVLVSPLVLYHDNDVYNITDAFYLMGSVILLGIGFNLFIVIRNYDLMYMIYLFLITIMTDTYAFAGGMLSGRHKLVPSVSPKKTIEGLVIGTIFGTLIACTFYYIQIDDTISITTLALVTLFLSLAGQVGDLVFSSIKRSFGIKDFSNIMPGHGGILDRLDSILFTMLGFMFFVSLL